MGISANRSQLTWSPVLGWVLLACATSAAQAQTETSSPAAQILLEQAPVIDIPDVPVSVTGAFNAPGEVGIAIGAFTLYPSIEVQAGYDSNVYATSAPTVGSPYTLIRPVVELKSDWLNHSFRISAGAGVGIYANASTQNYWNGFVQMDGRLDIREDFYATGLVAVRRQTEALGTPNALVATSPTVVDTIPVEVGLYQRFNRFFYDFKAAATRYNYTDNSIVSSGGLPAASRNRMEYDERVRLGYEVADGLDVWVAPGLNQRIYDQFVNAFGQQRDSTGWNVNFGATFKLTTKSILEGYVGYSTQTYIADGTTTPAFTFGLSGSWNGYDPLTIRPSFIRTINESPYSNYTNYVSTVLGIDFTYDIHDAWQMVGGTGINIADFTPAPGSGAGPRTDYYWRASLGLLYALRPQIQLGPLYEHTTGWSTNVPAGGPSYTREVISPGLLQDGDLVNLRPFLSRCLGPLLVAIALTVSACDPQPPASTMTIQQPSQGTQNLRLGEYRVAPGDRLRVVVLSDTELSGEYEVDSTGMISPRMAGRVVVLGMSMPEIEAMLADRYRSGGYLRNPRISVDLVSRRPFYIVGEIGRPGSFPYVSGINVLQAVAIAGGYTRRASKTRITIQRFNAQQGQEETVTEDSPVGPGDIIRVPERWF